MAKFRAIQTDFWQDDFTLSLTPEEKFFYIYLMTNTKSNQVGCYVLPKKIMQLETGYNTETVEKLINRFEEYGKILYEESTSEILIINWYKYNWLKSINTFKCILKELEEVKSEEFQKFIWLKIEEVGYLEIASYKELIEDMQTPYNPLVSKEKEKLKRKTKKNNKKEKEIEKEIEVEIEEEEQEEKNSLILTSEMKDEIMDNWNKLPIANIQTISPNRIKRLRILMQQYSFDDVIQAINNINKSKFLQGVNDRSWQITFDWFLNVNNFIKVLEGNYEDKDKNVSKTKFHNFKQLSENYDDNYLENLAKKKRNRLFESLGG